MSEHQVLDHVDAYLKLGVEYDASDVHLSTAFPPSWRVNGRLQPIWPDHHNLEKNDIVNLMQSYMTKGQLEILDEKGDVDFAYQNSSGRFRVSVVKQRLGYDMIFRVIKTEIRQMQELGLPMATLEPLLKTQREIESHTESFGRALRGALRQDPDVIIVGEMRDLETIELAITAAETGHLVFGTLHTGNAPKTLDRILDVFPANQREQIRTMVAESLRGVVSQQLIPKKDGNGRIATHEILINTPAVASLVREGKTFMLPGVMQVGKSVGMSRMDDSLVKHALAGDIAKAEAIRRAQDQKDVTLLLADLED